MNALTSPAARLLTGLAALAVPCLAHAAPQVTVPTLDKAPPTWVVARGETLSLTAEYDAQGGDGSDIFQFTVGIEDVGADCLVSAVRPVDGLSDTGEVTLTAPSEAGTYDVTWNWNQSYTCEQALGGHAGDLVHRPLNVLGTLYVGNQHDVFDLDIAGQGTHAVVTPGATVKVRARYLITRPEARSEISQLLLGLGDTGLGCVYDGIPSDVLRTGDGTVTFRAPTTPGTYTVTSNWDANYGCDLALPNYAGHKGRYPRALGTLVVAGPERMVAVQGKGSDGGVPHVTSTATP